MYTVYDLLQELFGSTPKIETEVLITTASSAQSNYWTVNNSLEAFLRFYSVF